MLIAGPTSSGKTTFAKRLCVALETLGARPTVVSVDSYYKGWADIDARGAKHVDWEALGSLDLELLNAQLLALLNGDEARAHTARHARLVGAQRGARVRRCGCPSTT